MCIYICKMQVQSLFKLRLQLYILNWKMTLLNNPSHVLTKKENNLVTGILGQDRISMCTTYVQIYTASEEEQNWLIEGTGPLCLVHDFQQNTFILVLIDASCDRVVWERELTHFTEYLSVSGKFHLLRFDELIGINFLCSLEAQDFEFKLNWIKEYLNKTHLVINTDRKSIKKSHKTLEIKHIATDIVIKPERPSSPIIRGKSCVKKCYKKLKKHSTKVEKQACFKSVLVPTSPNYKEKENIYQTLSDIQQLQTLYCPCFA